MTAEYAPDAIHDAFLRLQREAPKDWKLADGGITGNTNHTYGYHRSRNWCARYSTWKPVDYSITHADDKAGDGNAASAQDITPQGSAASQAMVLMTSRLLKAIDGGDPRAKYLAEVYGTVNGTSVVGRLYDGFSSADSSHLWHVHVAGRRRYADDPVAWNAIVDILLGLPVQYPPDHPKWSDTVTRDELVALIDERAEAITLDGLKAVALGGDHGAFTAKAHPKLIHAEGLQPRVISLEKAAKPATSKPAG